MKRSEDLWLSDGDLIIQAENVSFRIQAKALAESSTVFADMMEFPQNIGDDAEEKVDGVAVVRLFDSDADAAIFLKAIFDESFFLPPPSPTSITLLLDVLRLSNKYDAQPLFRRALLHLEALYPTTLAAFRAIPEPPHITHPDGPLAFHLAVLTAVTTYDARWLLPALLYEIACHPLRDILAAPAWDDLPAPAQRRILTTHAARLERLRVVNGIKFYDPSGLGCDWREGCPYNAHVAVVNLVTLMATDDKAVDALRYWTPVVREAYKHTRCGECLYNFERDIEADEKKVWEGLPATTGFAGWDEVMEMRAGIMDIRA
ncbi:hypothetical protein DFH07DRAFT_884069 [Mycena maculata]|uniref:BTB domain-containing protein n=1 Tax=Mycena maculata TaxID=230809 RepID=A0AAD7J9P3_9AGAR|nr:hypothetical protein DFH07DRAFT_884069 [Mycena maculata]